MLSISSTLKQIVFTFFFIFLIMGIISCEKHLQDYDLPTLDESADQFTKDLNDVLMTSNKTTHLLDALNRGDHLDWSKIVLRISSDLNANINYCIPIVKPGGICDDFVEISLSGPKTASNITIKKYDSSITVDKSNRMEIERIKKVLYRFAQMGLKVSPQLVEQQRIVIQEFDKKKHASLQDVRNKNKVMNTQKTKGTIQRVGPPETVDCFTVVNFEFYYQFTGYPGSNPTAWNYQVTTTFINQFYSYLNFDSQYYSTNPDGSLTFYNMPDGENHINSIIYNALNYAKNFCTGSFNLTESDLITYFFYAQYSTCTTGPGDGGGSLANGLIVENAPEEPEIINNIDINFVDDNFGTPLRIIGYTQDRGNTEDLEYGTNGDVSWAPPYLQNLLDDQYFFSMTDLFEKCTTFDSGLKSVGLDMIDKFRNGTGADYGNIILNQRATGSVQTLNFLKEFGATFNQQLLQANMNLNNVAPINMGGNRPKYDGLYNKFHGLQILVNDTEQSKIFLESFTPLPNNKWKAVVQLEIVDHFGLDLHDAQTYQDWHDGFPSWWILQHERNYRPFKTKIWVRLEMSVK